MWGLRADEVKGRNLYALDFGMPVDQLRETLRGAGTAGQPREVTVQATNRRGKRFSCRVVSSPMRDRDGHVHGPVLVLDAVDG